MRCQAVKTSLAAGHPADVISADENFRLANTSRDVSKIVELSGFLSMIQVCAVSSSSWAILRISSLPKRSR